MNDTVRPTANKAGDHRKAPANSDAASSGRKAGNSVQPQSRFEKFAATQAAGDGIEGDALKPDKTVDEKLGANMADRK
jgi:hypothetical protein